MSDSASPSSSTPAASAQFALRTVLMVFLLFLSRLYVFDHPIPVHGDEVGFIEGLGFPAPYPVHHPGYPLWVAVGTLNNSLGLAPYVAFQFWSVFGSIAAPWLLYVGLRQLAPDGLAWWTALAFGLNPLIWFTSVTALTYTTAIAFGILIVGHCWQAVSRQNAPRLIHAGSALAICIWLRLDYLAWLGPLFLYSIWRLRRHGGWRALIPVVVSLAFLVPVILLLYGRISTGRRLTGQFSYWLEVLFATSVFKLGAVDGLLRSTAKLGGILLWVLGPVIPAACLALFAFGRIRRRWPGAIPFLLLWGTPLTAFVLLIHMSEPGHIIPLVPAAYCMFCVGIQCFARPATAARIASALALCSAVQFLGYRWSTQAVGWRKTLNAKIAYLSASGLRQIDHRWDIHTPSDIWPTAVHHPTATRPQLPR